MIAEHHWCGGQSGETECRIPLGPGVVGDISGIMEWQMYDVRDCKKPLSCHDASGS